MPRNETDILNLALAHLGIAPVASTSDDSAAATVFRQVYEAVRDDLLEDYDWSFARVNAALTTSASTVTGWTYIYSKPTNALKIWKVYTDTTTSDPEGADYEESGSLIAVNGEDAYIQYTERVTDPANFDIKFAVALSYKLALAIAPTLATTDSKIEKVERKAMIAVSDAKRANARRSRITRTRTPASVGVR